MIRIRMTLLLPGNFTDACAVQLPAKVEADLPAPQMGEDGRAVEIVYWSASWQASVNGRPDNIQAMYPRAAVDHYPFQAPSLKEGSVEQQEMANRYAPAHALGNNMAGPRTQPVQDLIAEGPGTLRPAATNNLDRKRCSDRNRLVGFADPEHAGKHATRFKWPDCACHLARFQTGGRIQKNANRLDSVCIGDKTMTTTNECSFFRCSSGTAVCRRMAFDRDAFGEARTA